MSAKNSKENKALRREARKEGKGVADYNFSDLKMRTEMITHMHSRVSAMNSAIEKQYGVIRPTFDLQEAISALEHSVSKFTGKLSKYVPHQGKQEVARRLKQIQSGFIKVSV